MEPGHVPLTPEGNRDLQPRRACAGLLQWLSLKLSINYDHQSWRGCQHCFPMRVRLSQTLGRQHSALHFKVFRLRFSRWQFAAKQGLCLASWRKVIFNLVGSPTSIGPAFYASRPLPLQLSVTLSYVGDTDSSTGDGCIFLTDELSELIA